MPHRARIATLLVWAALAGALDGPGAGAGTTQIWKHRTRAEREQGDLQRVAVQPDGSLTLGPAVEMVSETPDPYVWSLLRDSRGRIYAGTGNEGKVYRLEKHGKPELVFDAPELEVHALAADRSGNLFVGTSPDGKIYRVEGPGRSAVFFDPGEKYIWSLVFDRRGDLYAATGTEGRVYRIAPTGRGEVLLDSEETHVRVLALDAQGRILAGTDGKGVLQRIDPSTGRVEGLANSPLPEVTAIATGPEGKIYFAAAGQAARGPQRPSPTAARPAPAAPPAAEGERPPGQPPETAQQTPAPPQPPPAQPPPPSVPALEGKVLCLEPDGYAREIWSATGEMILSLALDADGNLIAGSGSEGKVHRIDPRRAEASLLHKSSSQQVTALLAEPGGSTLAAGSNLGSILRIGGGVAAEGTFESTTFDAKVYSTWGRITTRSEVPTRSAIEFAIRTGDTPEPDASWSDWIPDADKSGAEAKRPRGRYARFRAKLVSRDGRTSPRLGEVALPYLQRNFPPELRSLEVQGPGVVFQKPNKAGTPGSSPQESSAAARGERTARRPVQQPRPQPERDGRAVQWNAVDPNGDDLLYSVYYRGVEETEWKLMDRELTDPFFSWDGTAMADGTYLLRVVADDAPSNPPGASLTSERWSDPFDVDNNPPGIGEVRTSVEGSRVRIEFEVVDAFSIVATVEMSRNAGEWRSVTPRDGLADATREEFRIEIDSLPAGEHTVVIRARDAAGNSVTTQTVFRIAAGG
jgi:sugar lactone lactonase YvrE